MSFKTQIDKRLALAISIADSAHEISLPAFHQGVVSKNKENGGFYDPVTKADTDTELHLRKRISAAFPDDGISGEEFPDKPCENEWSWCLDPIDGTRAFVAGVPVWSTLISACYNEKPVIGIIDHPALNDRFIGAHGKAWRITARGETRLKTNKCARLNDAVLSCTEPLAMFSSGQRGAYEMIRRTVRFSRLGLDAYGYALTAAGRIDLVIEARLNPFDVMALIPIIEGAGGAITDWHGGPASKGGAIVCGGDPNLLPQVYPYLQRALDI
ncbi:MAG: inositol monophosphatase family protein [Robiginitomaculum sp.]